MRTSNYTKHYAEMFRHGTVGDSGYRDLKTRAEKDLQQYRAELARIDKCPE